MANLFDGPMAGLAARAMAKMNAEAEAEAVERLDPTPSDSVVVLGFGPGIGISWLAKRLPVGRILGIDPSAAMGKIAARRNKRAIREGRVTLERARADRIPATGGSFDGAIAVNTLQLCEPLDHTARELARVLRPGARLVSLTHRWVMGAHSGSEATWLENTRRAFASSGFCDVVSFAARAEKGRSVVLIATRGPNPISPRA